MLQRTVPNILTLGNLFSGCMAVVFALNGDIGSVWMFTLVSLILDFLDGFTARRLNAQSPIGRQLDSLADLVSFGLVPSLIVLRIWSRDPSLMSDNLTVFPNASAVLVELWPAFLITLASAWRLAKFNLQPEDPGCFIGLSTPVNAVFWVFLPIWIERHSDINQIVPLLTNGQFLVLAVLISSGLLIAPIRFWSLKRLPKSLKEGLPLGVLGLIALVVLPMFGWSMAPGLVVLYIVLSLLFPPSGRGTA